MASNASDGALRFDGRVAIITGSGGAGGLGREMALELARRGAKVIINGRRREMVDEAVEAIRREGGEAAPCYGSVAGVDVAEKLVQTALDSFGSVDILINNAAVSVGSRSITETSAEDYHTVIDIGVRGAWLVTQAAWPHMQKAGYGRIINLVSQVILGQPNDAIYAASKGAILAMSRSLAVAGKDHGILVNCFSPLAYTEGVQRGLDDGDGSPENAAFMKANLPVRTAAQAPIWLCHEDMKYTGETLVSGGGAISRLFLTQTRGMATGRAKFNAEFVRDHFEECRDEKGYCVPTSAEESIMFLASSWTGQ